MEGGGRLRASLGALVERDYRLLFAATLVTSVGDAVAVVALAFAVLDVASARSARRSPDPSRSPSAPPARSRSPPARS